MNRVNSILFCVICAAFSAVMLVMTLFGQIELARASDAIAQMQAEAESLREENGVLRARYENSISLEEIEKYATERLGMKTPGAGQIIYSQLG